MGYLEMMSRYESSAIAANLSGYLVTPLALLVPHRSILAQSLRLLLVASGL